MCAGHGCGRVCVWVWASVCGYARVCAGVSRCGCAGVGKCAQVCAALQSLDTCFTKKIRIGYVLKSACMRTRVQIYAHPCTIVHTPHTHAHPHPPTEHPCTPAHTRAHLRTLVHTRAHPGTPAHTRAHPHTPAHIPHIPADALNLINQMNYM